MRLRKKKQVEVETAGEVEIKYRCSLPKKLVAIQTNFAFHLGSSNPPVSFTGLEAQLPPAAPCFTKLVLHQPSHHNDDHPLQCVQNLGRIFRFNRVETKQFQQVIGLQ